MTQLVWRQLYPEPVEQKCHEVSWASSSLALNVGPSNLGLPLALARKKKERKEKIKKKLAVLASVLGKTSQTKQLMFFGDCLLCLNDILIFKRWFFFWRQ